MIRHLVCMLGDHEFLVVGTYRPEACSVYDFRECKHCGYVEAAIHPAFIGKPHVELEGLPRGAASFETFNAYPQDMLKILWTRARILTPLQVANLVGRGELCQVRTRENGARVTVG